MGRGIKTPRLARSLFVWLLVCLFILPQPAGAFFIGGFTIRDEKELGRKFEVMVRSSMPVVADPEIRTYVNYLLARLLAHVPPQPFTFRSNVVLHNALNAFAVPGGNVFVFSGLIMNLDNEAELAGVLAHELAHVTQRHIASRVEKAQYASLGSLLLAIAGIAIGGPGGAPVGVLANSASQAAMLNYSRLDESEADNVGLQYLVAAGYPPAGMVGGFRALRKKSRMNGVSIPTYLSTHPAIGDRVNSMAAYVATMPAAVRNRKVDNTRFRRVQTLLWGRYGDPQAVLLRFNGGDGLSLMGRGMALARQNRVEEAARAFQAAVAAAPQDPLVLREAGGFHFRKGRMRDAGSLLTRAMQLDRKDYMASFYYGRLLDETGHEKEAARYYRDVLLHVPEDPAVHEALARCLARTGDEQNAYIHMTYGAMYANNRKLTRQYFERAKSLAENSGNKSAFNRLETAYNERKEIWGKS